MNAVYLYDEKVLITFNYKDGTKTITFDEIAAKDAPEGNGSDLGCFAPPKKPQRMKVRWGFCITAKPDSLGGWIRTAAATSLKTAQKQPSGLFLAARLAISTCAHQKTSTYASTLRFLYYCKARLTGQVDSNSCDDVAEDGAKTALMDRQVHRGCCYTMILLTLTFL